MRFLAWLMTLYLRLVWATARVRVEDAGGLRARALRGDARLVYCMWHGRLLGVTADLRDGVELSGIASRSSHGDFASWLVEPFGAKLIRGSSANPRKPTKDKGGAAALAAALRVLQNDPSGIVALTPDGPKGPRGVCHHGVAAIATRAGVPVVPVAWSARRALQFSSWDRALVPLPFTTIQFKWGLPLHPPPSDAPKKAVEVFRQEVERALLDLTVAADMAAGRAEHFDQAIGAVKQ